LFPLADAHREIESFALKTDAQFWTDCDNEWGKGSGYRDRISGRNRTWFNAQQRQQLEQELRGLVEREWNGALTRVTALFEK
jgi:hypothetical protein